MPRPSPERRGLGGAHACRCRRLRGGILEAFRYAVPAPEVRGTPYHPLHNPYLTAAPAATMLVLVNAMPKGHPA